MIIPSMKRFMVLTGLAAVLAAPAHGDSLSCAEGKQLMCLGYGDKVVRSNTVCLDPLSCDQKGFVCKSELDGISEKYEKLANEHNTVVGTYNELLVEYKKTIAEYDAFNRCVNASSTLEEAKSCQ